MTLCKFLLLHLVLPSPPILPCLMIMMILGVLLVSFIISVMSYTRILPIPYILCSAFDTPSTTNRALQGHYRLYSTIIIPSSFSLSIRTHSSFRCSHHTSINQPTSTLAYCSEYSILVTRSLNLARTDFSLVKRRTVLY